jgi:ribosomal protein S4E
VSRQPLGLVLVLSLPIIADHLELWKKISIEHDGYLNLEKLSKDRRNIKITKIKRKDGAFFAGDEDMFYVMYYNGLDKQRKNELNRFFSDLVPATIFM